MALENPYCTLADVQRETGNSDTDLVSQFEDAINRASRWIEEYCHTDFLLHDHSTTLYTVSIKDAIKDKIFLPWPIITLTEITADSVVIPADEYRFYASDRDVRLRSGKDWLLKTTNSPRWTTTGSGFTEPLEIKGTFGYATPPAAVAIACTQIASVLTHEKRRERVGMDGGRTSILDENIPQEAKDYLKRFKRLVY